MTHIPTRRKKKMTIKNRKINENGDVEYNVTVFAPFAVLKNAHKNENGDTECDMEVPIAMLLPIFGGAENEN
jgi:hypothetical protein